MRSLLLAAAAALPLAARATKATPPHIVFNLVDDWGWANWGYHSQNNSEVVTPNIDALAAEGIVLVRDLGAARRGHSERAPP